MKICSPVLPVLATALACSILLSACGGDHHDNASAPAAPESGGAQASEFTLVKMRIAGEAMQNATVCLDLNQDDECNGDDPSAQTDATGTASVKVPNSVLGKDIPWVAIVPAGAIGAVSGPVEIAYKLGAPNAATGVISANSSLVQIEKEVFGTDTATAVARVQDMLQAYNLSFDPLADFSASDEGASQVAASIGSVLVMLKQELIRPTGMRAGYYDVIDNVVRNLFGEAVLLATSPDLASITDPELRLFVLRTRVAVLAAKAGLMNENITSAIAESHASPPVPAPAGSTMRTLRYVRFNNLSDYDFSIFEQTPMQAAPDAGGLLHFTETRRRAFLAPAVDPAAPPLTVVQQWGAGYQRNMLVWNGASWYDCPEDFASNMTVPDAEGAGEITYCQNYRYRVRLTLDYDLSGQSYDTFQVMLGGVLQKPGEPSIWPDAAIPDSAVLPKGARISIQFRTPIDAPDSYSTIDIANVVRSGTACTTAPAQAALSLEDLLQLSGVKCASGAYEGSWDYALLRLSPGQEGRVANSISASFSGQAGGNRVTYWRCDAQSNCSVLSQGNYSIDLVGGARILHLTEQPDEVAGRSFVQRDGLVYYGNRQSSKEIPYVMANQIAFDALLSQLGVKWTDTK